MASILHENNPKYDCPSFPDDITAFFLKYCDKTFIISNRFILYYYKNIIDFLKNKNLKEILKSLRFAKNYTWEMMYSKHFSDVDEYWFVFYSLFYFINAYVIYDFNKDWKKCMKLMDKALVIDAPLTKNFLLDFIEFLKIEHKDDLQEIIDNSLIKSKKYTVPRIQMPLLLKGRIPIERRDSLSLSEFREKYYQKCPVIITNSMNDWPAMTSNRWGLEYLLRIGASRTIPIEMGKKYTDELWFQKMMKVEDFVDHISSNCEDTVYLAQYNLFRQFPCMLDDILDPQFCFVDSSENEPHRNVWIGPAGTITPLHTDNYENIFTQVVGQKYLRLYSENLTPFLSPYSNTMLSNTSQIDLDNISSDMMNELESLSYYDCVINPGEMLYMPKLWWHYVKSLSVSFSISFWW